MEKVQFRISEIHITRKAMDFGVTELDIYKLVFGLQNEYLSHIPNIPELHFCYKEPESFQLTIAGIFEQGEHHAEVCICMFDELEEGKIGSLGRELLYPRKAEKVSSFSIIRMADIRQFIGSHS